MSHNFLEMLSNNFIFVFGILPNVFILAYPEACFAITKGVFGDLTKSIKWFLLCPLLLIPFGWIIIYISLIFLWKITTISISFSKIKF